MGRPREHGEPTRERLLLAAAALSAREGWDAVSVRRVAREAETTTRAVYALFGSKRGLEEALHEEMFARLLELMRAIPKTDDPRADLLELRHAYRNWATERPDRYAALMRFVGPRAGSRSPEGLAAARAATAELREAFARCAEAGLIDAADLEALAIQWRAIGHGLAEFENAGVITDGDETWRTVLTAVIEGHAAARPPAAA
ncbi:MAG: TetR family transcriptional regulator [Solirubrobacterales bacterium]|nr:TetR family transcriptional regulator [Solirubrobacterales bacterium]